MTTSAPKVRIVEQFTGERSEAEFYCREIGAAMNLLEENAALRCRLDELEAENQELRKTTRPPE